MLNTLAGITVNPEDLHWLLHPRAFKKTLISRIEQAKCCIYISTLYLEDDQAGREVLGAILKAKANNPKLEVIILVDAHRARRGLIGQPHNGGNALMYQSMLAEAKQDIAVLGVPIKFREIFGVLHLKGFIIDDWVIYSGASLNDVYLQQGDRYRFDRYHVFHSRALAQTMKQAIEGIANDQAVIDLGHCSQSKDSQIKGSQDHGSKVRDKSAAALDKTQIRAFKKRLRALRYQFDGVSQGLRVTPVLGFGRKGNLLNKMILALVNESCESLFICTPYFNFPRSLMRAILAHLKQGKRLDLIVGDKVANDFYLDPSQTFSTIGVLPYVYEQSLRGFAKKCQWAMDSGQLNIHLWQDRNNSFHLKGVSCDERYHLLTGHNLNPRAWGLDLENGLLIQDGSGRLQQQFRQEQQHLLTHTCRLEHYKQLDTPKSYPPEVRKVNKRLGRLGAKVLIKRLL